MKHMTDYRHCSSNITEGSHESENEMNLFCIRFNNYIPPAYLFSSTPLLPTQFHFPRTSADMVLRVSVPLLLHHVLQWISATTLTTDSLLLSSLSPQTFCLTTRHSQMSRWRKSWSRKGLHVCKASSPKYWNCELSHCVESSYVSSTWTTAWKSYVVMWRSNLLTFYGILTIGLTYWSQDIWDQSFHEPTITLFCFITSDFTFIIGERLSWVA